MTKNNNIQKKIIQRTFWQILPFMCILLLWREYGNMEFSWSYAAMFSIELIVGIGITYATACYLARLKIKNKDKHIFRN